MLPHLVDVSPPGCQVAHRVGEEREAWLAVRPGVGEVTGGRGGFRGCAVWGEYMLVAG